MAKSNRTCSIEGCNKPVRVRDFCNAHYLRLIRHGDPLAGGTPQGKALEFFHSVVLTYEGDECIRWPFNRDRKGYAQLSYKGRGASVSRLVCEHKHGPPPTAKHEAAHNCGKGHEGCVSPACVYWKTHAENCADKIAHGTLLYGENHPNSILTEEDISEIRKLIGTIPQRVIAERFGVCQAVISLIKTGKIWRHLQGSSPES